MALIVADRVKETTATTGTSDVVLAGPASGFQAFSGVMASGDTCTYAIISSSDWETGEGTYDSGSNTLTRDVVLESSNTGSKISLSGTSTVFLDYPAKRAVYTNNENHVVVDSGIDLTPLANGSQPAWKEGRIFYDDENKTLALYNEEVDVTLQLGLESYVRVRNNSGATITNGKAVYISGSQGTHAEISLANASGEGAADAIGLATHDIEDGTFGYVTTFGLVRGVDTSGLGEGSGVYLTSSGNLSSTPASPPSHLVLLGYTVTQHASNGTIFVQPHSPRIGDNHIGSTGAINDSGIPYISSATNDGDGVLSTSSSFVYDVGNDRVNLPTGGIYFNDATVQTTRGVASGEIGYGYFDRNVTDSFKFLQGNTLDTPVISISGDGSTVYMHIQCTGAGIRYVFSDGIYTLPTQLGPTGLYLATGTDPSPQMNYVYIDQGSQDLMYSTSAWPTGEHARVAEVLVPHPSSVPDYGVYKLHAWTDHAYSRDGIGHLAHLNEWVRNQPATWKTGALCTPTAGASQFDIAVSNGEVFQLHLHDYTGTDTSNSGEVVLVVNDNTTAYKRVGDLTGELTDADGDSMSNNWYNLVIWGVVSEDEEDCQVMVNLPTSSYNNNNGSKATNDLDQTAVYDIPTNFLGVGFLIARLTVEHNGSTFTVQQNEDLRGKFPSTTPGGGATGGGVTELIELTDVDSAGTTANYFLATPTGAAGNYSGRAIESVDLPSTIIESGDNVSLLNNDAGYSAESGDVRGPASSTDNGIVRFDGTTGKVIQDSSTTIDDNGKISSPGLICGAVGIQLGQTNYMGFDSITVTGVTNSSPQQLSFLGANLTGTQNSNYLFLIRLANITTNETNGSSYFVRKSGTAAASNWESFEWGKRETSAGECPEVYIDTGEADGGAIKIRLNSANPSGGDTVLAHIVAWRVDRGDNDIQAMVPEAVWANYQFASNPQSVYPIASGSINHYLTGSSTLGVQTVGAASEALDVQNKAYTQSIYNGVASPTGATNIELDLDAANIFNITMDSDKTLTIKSGTDDTGQKFLVNLRQASGVMPGSGYTPTWWSNIKWTDPGEPSSYSDSGNLIDTFGFQIPSGNKFFGYVVGTGIYDG